MPLIDQRDRVARPIHDHGKEVENVPPEHAHVQAGRIRYSGTDDRRRHRPALMAVETNLDLNVYRGCYTTNAFDGERRRQAWQRQHVKDVCSQDGSVSPSVHQERRYYRRPVCGDDLRPYDRPTDFVDANFPCSINARRLW